MCEVKILGAAKSAEISAHGDSEFWTEFGYVLFVVGWGLTLLGKLAKKPSIQEATEED
jgi:hypothetical protein